MTTNTVRGIAKNADLSPALVARDTRSWRSKLADFATDGPAGAVIAIMGVLYTVLPFVGITFLNDFIAISAIFFWLYSRNKKRKPQFRIRQQKSPNGKIEGDGIFFLGNDLTDNTEVWFSNDDLRTHMLVFGSTGSGKTRFLLGMLYQSMLVGSGCMYVDGKGDNTVWWLVYSFCRRLDRLEDLLVINYLTGVKAKKSKSDTRRSRISNTTNPFSQGSGEDLRSLIVGLMRQSGGDGDMWKGMASIMMGGLLLCLTYMRDQGEIILDVAKLRETLPLDAIVKLSFRADLPDKAIAPIKKYLTELPGYVEDDALLSRINPKVYEQHGYRIMQFSEVLGDLEETYGHIFSDPLGEVDFKDVVYNRRILFVMLPALQKDPDALAGLGKLVVAGVRSALSPALGEDVEGYKTEVIDQKPTNSDVPFVIILDEYGYYSVEGFAVVAAQARSLGVSVVFAGQDYPSFKRGSEKEAQATIANTNIKLGMKVEEKETADIIIDRAGKGKVTVTEGSERNSDGIATGYKDSDRVRAEERNKVDMRDLVNQKAGQAHIIFADNLARCQLFFSDPVQVDKAALNKFVMVEPPKKSKIAEINGVFSKFDQILTDFKNGKAINKDDKKFPVTDSSVKQMFADFEMSKSHDESDLESSILAVCLQEIRLSMKDSEIEAKAIEATALDKPKVKTINLDLADIVEEPVKPKGPTKEEIAENEEILAPMEEAERPKESIGVEANEHSIEFESLLNQAVLNEMSKRNPTMTAHEKSRAEPANALFELEKYSGKTDDVARRESVKAIEILGQKTSYPKKPTPIKVEFNDLNRLVKDLADKI